MWNAADYTYYRDKVPRFCAEFGFQGPPAWATLTRWIHDERLTPTSPGFLQHQKAGDGDRKLRDGMAPHLSIPSGFEDWHWATQLNQARAVTLGIEHFRSWWPRTAGALVWQLNDCWPATSWAAVDYDERPKPLYYAMRHAFAPRLLTIQPRDGRSMLVAVNDHDERWAGQIVASRETFAGEALVRTMNEFAVPPRSAAVIEPPDDLLKPIDPAHEVLIATAPDAHVHHLFAEDRDLAYDPAPLTGHVTQVEGGYQVTVRATSFARDVAVLADKLAPDAIVDDMLVSLSAGQTFSLLARTSALLDNPSALLGARVLRCANALEAPGFGP